MACCGIGGKRLPEQVVTQFTEAYVRHVDELNIKKYITLDVKE